MAVRSRFQSAPPVRGATVRGVELEQGGVVSIRAPRERGDGWPPAMPASAGCFNPRPP